MAPPPHVQINYHYANGETCRHIHNHAQDTSCNQTMIRNHLSFITWHQYLSTCINNFLSQLNMIDGRSSSSIHRETISWSSESCGFDPRLGLRNRFSKNRAWQTFINHFKISPSSHISKVYISLANSICQCNYHMTIQQSKTKYACAIYIWHVERVGIFICNNSSWNLWNSC